MLTATPAYAADGAVAGFDVAGWAAIGCAGVAAFLFWRLKQLRSELARSREKGVDDLKAAETGSANAALLAERNREFAQTIATLEERLEEMARTADQVAKAKEAAEAANKAKTQFLAMMSHELRTPLNAILGFSEIIRSEALGPLGADEYSEYAGDIYSSGAHLLALINDLLDLAKVESGMVEVREEVMDPAEMIDDAVRIIAKTDAARGVKLLSQPAEGLPRLRADKRKLRQILMNLLSNAVKFTNEGKAVAAKVYLNAEGGLVFEVADGGIGIAEADIAKVMEPFVQIDSALNRQQQGTGLGLPLCKQLTELHGGVFELESTLNEGTTVRIVMPPERSCLARADAA